MLPSDDMASQIRRLGDAESGQRERAATEIFQRGLELARATTEQWLADVELAALLVTGETQAPEATVGLAVERQNFLRIRIANGSPRLADVPPDQDAEEFELHFGQGVRLDVLTTKDPQGAGVIARFLQKFGEGIQQIELLVRDVDRATDILHKRYGVDPIYPQTRAGADGTRVNFFLAPTPQGKKVLIELVEAAAKPRSE
ncbi:MAG TPA: hypothetical protein VEX69_00950 [Candidatus Limnocylindria bacterium]|nr:hypothetical protein [Candidatus Limnocylindria bacterium]